MKNKKTIKELEDLVHVLDNRRVTYEENTENNVKQRNYTDASGWYNQATGLFVAIQVLRGRIKELREQGKSRIKHENKTS